MTDDVKRYRYTGTQERVYVAYREVVRDKNGSFVTTKALYGEPTLKKGDDGWREIESVNVDGPMPPDALWEAEADEKNAKSAKKDDTESGKD